MAANIERIKRMETYLNECAESVSGLSEELEKLEAIRANMISLFGYYGSKEWFDDLEADLPEGTGAGVLSEDAVYDTLTDTREAAFHMLELAVDILKNRI